MVVSRKAPQNKANIEADVLQNQQTTSLSSTYSQKRQKGYCVVTSVITLYNREPKKSIPGFLVVKHPPQNLAF